MRAVNLLPRDLKRRRAPLAPQVKASIGGALLVPVLVAGMYTLASGKVADERRELEGLRAELAATPPPPAPTAAEMGLKDEQDQRLAVLASALSTRVAWDRVLRELSAIVPEDVWLTSLAARGRPLQPPGALAVAAPDRGLTIKGYTYSQEGVARLLARLAVVPDLVDVALESSTLTTVENREVVQFTIEADVRAPEASS